ncbi:MAG: hopanoid biosynthesis-associated protein HpnK [Syntrophales bacterium]
MKRKLIVTGDDFGASRPVNESIEEAHRRGILSTASLMVGAAAAVDAVDRSRRLGSLRVGLHLVLVNGSPLSAPSDIPGLVEPEGRLRSHLFRAATGFFFQSGVRRQLEQEIRAQFQAFRDTGLHLDHVNCHKHMHLHPTIGGLVLKVGREFGLKAVRYPYEPLLPSCRASKSIRRRSLAWLFLLPWQALLKARLRRAHVRSNDYIFGMHDSGAMDIDLVLGILKHLPPGVSEIYFHPGGPADSGCREELTLTSPALRQALDDCGIRSIGFGDL